MLRRDARLRREYLHRKGLEGKERLIYEKKRKVKEALEAGKPIPTELRAEGREIQHAASMDDARTETLKTHVDDEYARLGVQDPRILITTSRDPSSRLTSFVKELRLVFPNSQRLNRGNAVVKELVEAARGNDFSDLIIIHEHRGEPDGMIVCHLPYGPTAYFGLSNVVLRHDLSTKLGTMSEAAPHLIFDNFSTQLGERISTVLKALFPVPKPDSRRVMTFANRDDTISFRHHVYTKGSGGEKAEVDLGEVGPRFEAKIYQLKLGTVEQSEAENEWVLRPYQNTAKKRKAM